MFARKLLLAAFVVFALIALITPSAYAEDAAPATPEEVTDATLGLSAEDREKIADTEEKFEFQAEVSRLMDIIINSLYSKKEIFLRELISNASDALDKIRFRSLTDKSALGETEELEMRIAIDKEARTLTIRDTGVGMTKAELVKNLGVVANSGTTEFVKAAAEGTDALQLIGQFGVGFYSVYLIADKVTVASKSNDDVQYVWESTANQVFTVAQDPRGNTLGRGTSITLHLKEDADEFLDQDNLKGIVGRYSEFIQFPIYVLTSKTVTKEVPVEETTEEAVDEEAAEDQDDDDLEVSEEDEDVEEDTPKTETVTEEVKEWERVNSQPAIWTRSPQEVSDEEYDSFFKTLTKDESASALTHIHFRAEGEITFRSILYIPEKAPQGFWDTYYEQSSALKLFVRKVLIADKFEDFMPRYLSFVRGVVDSDDLPLNVSRETLSQSRILKVMGKKLTRKALEMLRKLAVESEDARAEKEEEDKEAADLEAEEDADADLEEEEPFVDRYATFWEQFGNAIKLGVMDDQKNRPKLIELLRFQTSKSEDEFISLERYVEGMKEEQEYVYYITGESLEAVKASPFLEQLTSRNLEVLYLTQPIDEYLVGQLPEYDGKRLMSATKEGLKFGDEDENKEKKLSEAFSGLTTWLKDVYAGQVQSVVVSNRIAESPCVLVTSQWGHSANMQRILRAQTLKDDGVASAMAGRKIMEINPRHPLIRELRERSESSPEDQQVKDLAYLLLDAAQVTSGFDLGDADAFAQRIYNVLGAGLGVEDLTKFEDEVLPEDPVEEEEEEEEVDELDDDEDDEEEEEETEGHDEL